MRVNARRASRHLLVIKTKLISRLRTLLNAMSSVLNMTVLNMVVNSSHCGRYFVKLSPLISFVTKCRFAPLCTRTNELISINAKGCSIKQKHKNLIP